MRRLAFFGLISLFIPVITHSSGRSDGVALPTAANDQRTKPTANIYTQITGCAAFTIRDIDQFQDNFATDGTVTGCVRADMANDIRGSVNETIVPGDSAVVVVIDPCAGLADDPTHGGKAVYLYVRVLPPQPAKSGAALTDDPVRFPYVGIKTIDNTQWDCIRLDQATLNGNPVANTFCVDLNDCLFTPGDEVRFFYSAVSIGGTETFAFGSNLSESGTSASQAAAKASEFTCLPGPGWQAGGNILYVNGADGSRPFFDFAFEMMGTPPHPQPGILPKVDRYDIRGSSSSGANNGPGSRVTDIGPQLIDTYQKIVWDCGDLPVTLGDGSGSPDNKANDYLLLTQYLRNLQSPGGVYLCGDDVPTALAASNEAGAVIFKSTYLTYDLISEDHFPVYGFSPLGRGVADGCFDGDSFPIFDECPHCPLHHDFDVMDATGDSDVELTYGNAVGDPPTNGAVLSKRTINDNGVEVGVLLAGFSFASIRDDEADSISDRGDHMYDILVWLGSTLLPSTGTGQVARNSLSQNYPNPFNPTTALAFSIEDGSQVNLTIYDAGGRRVRELVNERRNAGTHRVEWNGRNDGGSPVASGVYFYRLVAGSFTDTKKMTILK